MSDFDYPMYVLIEELPVRIELGGAFAYDVPNGRPYSYCEAMRNGQKISREKWEELVAKHAN